MKKVLLICALALGCAAAQAESYNLVSLSYDNTQLWFGSSDNMENDGLMMMGHNSNSASLNGFGIQYSRGIPLTSLPMNLEVGLKWSMGFNDKSYNETAGSGTFKTSYSTSMMRLAIPVSYIYHFSVGNGFKVAPYAGLDFRFNLLMKTKVEESYGNQKDSETFSWFSKKDMGFDNNESLPTKRFQMGWHIGARLEWHKAFLGLEYGTDFMPFWSYKIEAGPFTYKNHINTGNFSLSLGYMF